LLQSMVAIRNSRPEVRLLVGGDGELIKKYLGLARELGISGSVEFLGYVPDKELAELYSSSALFVLPSVNKMEGFGIVALEALSYATPVITTEFAGSSEFIKNNNAGIVVPSRDSDALAKAVLTLLEDDTGSRSMGVRGAEAVNREFGWGKIARQMTGVYL
jgi:glycosyltransferase involved in cell wall biosynthesis